MGVRRKVPKRFLECAVSLGVLPLAGSTAASISKARCARREQYPAYQGARTIGWVMGVSYESGGQEFEPVGIKLRTRMSLKLGYKFKWSRSALPRRAVHFSKLGCVYRARSLWVECHSLQLTSATLTSDRDLPDPSLLMVALGQQRIKVRPVVEWLGRDWPKPDVAATWVRRPGRRKNRHRPNTSSRWSFPNSPVLRRAFHFWPDQCTLFLRQRGQ